MFPEKRQLKYLCWCPIFHGFVPVWKPWSIEARNPSLLILSKLKIFDELKTSGWCGWCINRETTKWGELEFVVGQDRVGRNCVAGQNSNQGKEDTEQIHGENLGTVTHTGSGCQIYSNEEIIARVNVIDVNHKGYWHWPDGSWYVVDKTSLSMSQY